MNYTLQELWDLFNNQEITVSKFIQNEYNKVCPLGVEAMTDAEATALSLVIENRLTRLLPCNTVYVHADAGIDGIKTILKSNLYSMVAEIRNIATAMTGDIATVHTRNKFNPIDNDNIDKAPIRIDDTSFTRVSNMISQIEYLKDKSRTLTDLYNDFTSICYILG